jgi:tetratricopeptide (TPR) repeat protein
VGNVQAVLGEDGDAELAASRIAAGLGTAETTASSEEIAWGFRKLFEALAREKPLIVVLDDIHWAEPTLLDLIEYVSTFARDVPLFLLCTARPDLFELRPAWATPKPNATLVTLEPLAGSETETLVDELRDVPAETKARIVEAAEGNPLFVEQLLAMQAENGGVELEIPPTIQALLAARIDRLEPEERTVIECASIEGRMFHRGSVAVLLPQQARAGAGSHLITLVRKEFIRPDRSQLAGDDGFRFGHILIRDTAYDSIPKQIRAELHERFADWLEARLGDDAPGEIVGYHLERAYRYRVELGLVADESEALARRAAERLQAAGERASARGDMAAAANLLGRTVELLPADDPDRLELMPNWAAALIEVGELARADSILELAVEAAVSAGNQRVEWRARLGRATAQVWLGGSQEQAAAVAEQAAEALAQIGDELGLARAWNLVALTRFWLGSTAVAEDAWRSALEHALRARSSREEAQALSWLLVGSWIGPAPVETAILRCLEAITASPTRQVEAMALLGQGPLLAMRGDFAEARKMFQRGKEMLQDLGLAIAVAGASQECFDIEMLAGDPVAAEAELRGACTTLERLGEKGFLSTRAGFLAHALCAQGRYEEAQRFIEVAADAGAADDGATQALWRSARAKVTAAQDDFEAAEQLAREAVRIVEPTDWLNLRGDALVDLAEVLRLAGRPAEARAPLEEAIRLFEQKGNVVAEQRARVTLGELQEKR